MSKAKMGMNALCGCLLAAATLSSLAIAAERPKKSQTPPQPSSMQSDRQAISLLGADRNVMDSNLRSQHAVIERDMVSSRCQSLYDVIELATKDGVAAIKARLERCKALNEDAAKLDRDSWSAWQERIQRDNVPKAVAAELQKTISKAQPRFLEKQTAALAAADAHAASVAALVSFAEKITGKLKTQGDTLIIPAASTGQFMKLRDEADAQRIAKLRAERVLIAQSDGAIQLLQCALDGHTATSKPSIQVCLLKARTLRAAEQLAKDIERIEGAPLRNATILDSLSDHLVSREGLISVRALLQEVRSRTTNSVLAIDYSFAELDNALNDAEVAAEDSDIVNAKSESIHAAKATVDSRYAAYMDFSAALDQLIVFFESNFGRVQKSSGAFVFSSQAQYAEYSKIIARYNAAQSRMQELNGESKNKLGQMKDLMST